VRDRLKLARLWRACPPLEGLPASGGLARLWRACPPLEGLPASGGLASLRLGSLSAKL